jgi:hypothetical protein
MDRLMERTQRARLDAARIVIDGDVRTAEVTLTYKGAVAIGKAHCEGADTSADLRGVARATIAAAREIAHGRFSCVVQLAEMMEVCGSEFALVNAMLYAGGRVVPVLGSCLLRGDVADAAARATLDAVNRWLDLSLRGLDLEGFDELDAYGRAQGLVAPAPGV